MKADRIEQTFAQNNKIISPYITAGFPKAETTVALMHQLVESGANILELGIPFSDPMAEGPVIQAAMECALDNHVTLKDVLAMVETFRQNDNKTPVILMGYLNPIEHMGYDTFTQCASRAGVDGTIIVDLPPEESHDVISYWRDCGLHMIYLCSPTTTTKRMQLINQFGSGYIYYVSLKGVTGSSSLDVDDVKQHYHQRKSQLSLPLLVGFGIKTAEHAAAIATFSDGIVVGAALIAKMFEYQHEPEQILHQVPKLIAAMREHIDKVRIND
jgi:tryptophan synthase alpha chain